MLQEQVENLLKEAFQEYNSLFLISLNISDQNHIQIVIDGDQGVSVNDCIAVSRKIENNLDREEEDFSLEVSSAGVSEPLRLERQYRKNLGRKLQVTTNNEKIEATLTEVDQNGIKLNWKAREPKPVGKGKHTVEKEAVLPYSEITDAKVIITF